MKFLMLLLTIVLIMQFNCAGYRVFNYPYEVTEQSPKDYFKVTLGKHMFFNKLDSPDFKIKDELHQEYGANNKSTFEKIKTLNLKAGTYDIGVYAFKPGWNAHYSISKNTFLEAKPSPGIPGISSIVFRQNQENICIL